MTVHDASPPLWDTVHEARRALVSDLAGLRETQWRQQSLCRDWDVEHVVAHLTAVATVGRVRWLSSIVTAGFRPSVHNDRRLSEHLGTTSAETLQRLEAVVDSTMAPTRDTAAYLGEVLVHSQDIRQPLGITTQPDVTALTAVAEFFARRDFTVPSRTLRRGLRLRATDGPFDDGEGPEVVGPTLTLVMGLAGRRAYLPQLSGAGVELLAARIG